MCRALLISSRAGGTHPRGQQGSQGGSSVSQEAGKRVCIMVQAPGKIGDGGQKHVQPCRENKTGEMWKDLNIICDIMMQQDTTIYYTG